MPKPDWRTAITRSRIFLLVWSATTARHGHVWQHLAYAQRLGKPIRVLLLGDARLPEDFCAGYADVETARVTTPEEGATQTQRWLDAVTCQEGRDG